MRVKLFISIIIAMIIVGCQQTNSFKEFTSQEGKFSVSMPGDPTEQTQTLNTEVGAIEFHFFTVERKDVSYMVGYSDYPREMIDNSEPDKILDGARDGAVSNVQGVLLSELLLTLDNYPGRELRIEAVGGKATIHTRIYLVNDRLYQILVASLKEDAFSVGASDFLDSFALQQ